MESGCEILSIILLHWHYGRVRLFRCLVMLATYVTKLKDRRNINSRSSESLKLFENLETFEILELLSMRAIKSGRVEHWLQYN